MTTVQVKDTLYRQWVRASVYWYAKQHKPHFTLKEFAKALDCSITMNLRRRMAELVKSGELTVDFAQSDTGGSCHVYTVERPN